jgi:hypothetical protein
VDDWVVVGPAGDWWVVPQDRFEATYRPVADDPVGT